MPASFHRVSQTLQHDSGRRTSVGLALACTLGAAWLWWAFHVRVTRYEVSRTARIEVNGSAYPVQVGLSGQIEASYLELGKEVHIGDVLADLDSEEEKLSLAEERTRYAAFDPQIVGVRAQMEEQRRGGTGERRVLGISILEAKARYQQADTDALLAETQARRAGRLRADGLISEADAQQADAEAKSKRAAAENMRIGVGSLEPELKVRESDRDVKLKQNAADIARLEAGKAASLATVQRLSYEIERRRIRAAANGRLSECAALRPGSHIAAGETIGVILPSEHLQIVAEFPPSAAFGKLRPGQSARMKLDGFPWTQYGSVPATVSRVAGEIRDGQVRVELSLTGAPARSIPLQHGLPGSVEVEVEQITPAALLLRSAGQLAGTQ